MKIKAELKEALQSLVSSKQRTFLAVIGITIGIGSVIAMVSIGKMVQNEAMKQFTEMGTDILTVQTKSRGFSLNFYNQIMDLSQNIEEITQVSPIVNSRGKIYFSGKEIRGISSKGVSQYYQELEKLKIKDGRFLSELDQNSQFAVIGNKMAQKISKLGNFNLIGSQFKIGEKLFTVIGTLEPTILTAGRFSDPNKQVYTHITNVLKINPRTLINSFKFKVKSGANHTIVSKKVEQYFARIKKSPKIEVESPEQLLKQMEKQMELYTMLLGAIAGISLVVGGVGVMNVMLVSVTERRKEIGIRRALGARRKNIWSQFLIESIVLSILGGAFGVLLGVISSNFASRLGGWEFLISDSAILIGLGVSFIVGVFFGFYPAVQASKLDPILALRST